MTVSVTGDRDFVPGRGASYVHLANVFDLRPATLASDEASSGKRTRDGEAEGEGEEEKEDDDDNDEGA